MITLEKLNDQEWYDGFLWNDGKQRGVTTLKWMAKLSLFGNPEVDPEHHYAHVDDGRFPSKTWRFEPNVVSIGEPAS
jgi:hypothetical protein